MVLTAPTPSTRRHLSHLMLLLEEPRLSPNRGWEAFLSRLAGAGQCAPGQGRFLQRLILLPGRHPVLRNAADLGTFPTSCARWFKVVFVVVLWHFLKAHSSSMLSPFTVSPSPTGDMVVSLGHKGGTTVTFPGSLYVEGACTLPGAGRGRGGPRRPPETLTR